MIHLLVYRPKLGFQREVPLEQINEVIQDPDAVLWLDLENPTPEEHQLLRDEFAFHPLALEDIGRAHQRPKIEEYEHFYFIILYTISLADRSNNLRDSEMALFVGTNYLVTVHHRPAPVLDEVAALWQSNGSGKPPSISSLLYSLLDTIVDDYFPVLDEVGDRIDDLEDRIFSEENVETLQLLFQLKKDLLALRRIIAPERDVVNVLMRREVDVIAPHFIVYFQDVYDHLVRLTDSVDTFRDLLSSALDAYLSVISNRLNQVMKILTALSAMLMSAALIAGIYGMNFHYMPELSWRYGYPVALGFMGLVIVGLAVYFRRKGWL